MPLLRRCRAACAQPQSNRELDERLGIGQVAVQALTDPLEPVGDGVDVHVGAPCGLALIEAGGDIRLERVQQLAPARTAARSAARASRPHVRAARRDRLASTSSRSIPSSRSVHDDAALAELDHRLQRAQSEAKRGAVVSGCRAAVSRSPPRSCARRRTRPACARATPRSRAVRGRRSPRRPGALRGQDEDAIVERSDDARGRSGRDLGRDRFEDAPLEAERVGLPADPVRPAASSSSRITSRGSARS